MKNWALVNMCAEMHCRQQGGKTRFTYFCLQSRLQDQNHLSRNLFSSSPVARIQISIHIRTMTHGLCCHDTNKTYIAQVWSIVRSIQVPIAVHANTERITTSVRKNLNTCGCRNSVIRFAVLNIAIETWI